MPKYVLFAGVNGSGKSTLYQTNGKSFRLPYVNLDDEIRKRGDWRDPSINIATGKQVIRLIRQYLNTKTSFIQETTLCGGTIIKNINYAKEQGYYIEIHFVAVESPEIAIERVHNRMAKGGHGVDDKDILRRFEQSFQNLRNILPLIDKTILYDNTISFRRIAVIQNGEALYIEDNLPEWYK